MPDALLASVITNYLLALWVFFYISCHYDPNYDNVYVQKGIGLGLTPKDDEIQSQSERKMLDKGFISQSRFLYICTHAVVPLVVGSTGLYYFFVAREWVENNKNQRNTYG